MTSVSNRPGRPGLGSAGPGLGLSTEKKARPVGRRLSGTGLGRPRRPIGLLKLW